MILYNGNMEIWEQLRVATERLEQAGCDSPRLDAEVLLAHVLGLDRAQLSARGHELLSADAQRDYESHLARRENREPLAYIVNNKAFYGLDLYVDNRVLIPRPETELLVEEALRAARKAAPDGALAIADIGTGSGAVAVSLAVHLPDAVIYAVDESAAALAVARQNCRRHGVGSRVRLCQGDLLGPLPEPVDLIVANLPYIARGEWETLAPEIRRFEPVGALDGGPDGLTSIRRLLAQASERLTSTATLLLEIGATHGPAVLQLAHSHFPGAEVHVKPDYAGLDRIVTVHYEP